MRRPSRFSDKGRPAAPEEFVKKTVSQPLYKQDFVWYNERTSVRGFFFVRSRSGHDGRASPIPEGGTKSDRLCFGRRDSV